MPRTSSQQQATSQQEKEYTWVNEEQVLADIKEMSDEEIRENFPMIMGSIVVHHGDDRSTQRR